MSAKFALGREFERRKDINCEEPAYASFLVYCTKPFIAVLAPVSCRRKLSAQQL